ncbi:MAG: prolyl aminopeptidase [Methylococcaceae bacterium]|nr:prolyl aminopeptidase [Methylococcaceae bacterium]
MKTLHPEIEPSASFSLEAGEGHYIYVEECGNPRGLPAVFLHGGPGSGCRPYHRRLFDPARYRVVLLDQRGSGRSTPAGDLEGNSTDRLLADLELVRTALGIDRWVVFGGSWGAALGLLYAQRHPERVLGLVLRGAFLARQRDLDWYLHDGASRLYPERWEELTKVLPLKPGSAILEVLEEVFYGPDELAKLRLARAWAQWGAQLTLGPEFDPGEVESRSPTLLLHQFGIELHYARHHYFIDDNQILDQCGRLPQVPTMLIHGRFDLVCPPESSLALKERIPWADLQILPLAGHSGSCEAMIDALVTASDRMAAELSP